MVDAPDRTTPRFPPDQVGRVTGEIRRAFERWQVGPGTTVVCGGARGADVIAAEEALARGAAVRLCLALPPDELEAVSVAGAHGFGRPRGQAGVSEVDGGFAPPAARTRPARRPFRCLS